MSTVHESALERGTSENGARKRATLRPGEVIECAREGVSRQNYFLYVPTRGGAESPLMVAVHGLARNADELAAHFAAHCEARGVVLVAPLFSQKFSDYQRLGRHGRGPRADAALEAILDEVVMLTGARATPIHLFGHSGGAQFVHRYSMAYPHRVAGAVVVNAGWYTFPKRRRRFPHGIRRSASLPDVRFDPDEFLRVPIAVLVGERDTTVNLRRSARVERQQGATRIERGRTWVDATRAAAAARQLEPLVSFGLHPEGAHAFAELMESCDLGARAMTALFGDAAARPSVG